MKQLYLLVCITGAFFIACIPKQTSAQCSCAGGDPVDSVVHQQYFDSITAANTSIVFPQFNPSIGTLNCFTLSSNVTTVMTLDILNEESFASTYLFEIFRRSRFSGPSGFVSNTLSPNVDYGPYDLGPKDPVGTADEVHIGPDTLFNNKYAEKTQTGSAPYVGAGNVTFDYLNTATSTLIQGSSNYTLVVRAYSRLNVRLVYYWCPNSILRSNLKQFSATRKSNQVLLQWLTENEESKNNYMVELSKNGTDFTAVSSMNAAAGGTAKYQYNYDLVPGASGRLFFRIKQTDRAGKTSYSPVRSVMLDINGSVKYGIYPNPASGKINLYFESPQSGKISVDIITNAGQVMETYQAIMNKGENLQMNFRQYYQKGVYWIRVKNHSSGEQQVTRLGIQ
jgi:hypothetical protein